jgi:hypothetical protein
MAATLCAMLCAWSQDGSWSQATCIHASDMLCGFLDHRHVIGPRHDQTQCHGDACSVRQGSCARALDNQQQYVHLGLLLYWSFRHTLTDAVFVWLTAAGVVTGVLDVCCTISTCSLKDPCRRTGDDRAQHNQSQWYGMEKQGNGY